MEIGECRVVGLLIIDGGGSVVCVSLCRSFSDIKVCGFRDTLSNSIDGWYLVRLTYLGHCGWK